jgi:hypothetical protein
MIVSPGGLPFPPPGYPVRMTIGTSLFLLAVGAILKFAVSDSVSGVDIPAIGVILMIVGVIGLLLSLLYMNVFARRDRDVGVVREREYR